MLFNVNLVLSQKVASSSAATMATRTFVRSLALQATSQQQAAASSSSSSSYAPGAWRTALASNSFKKSGSKLASWRQNRPMVNGKRIAFHVNDLGQEEDRRSACTAAAYAYIEEGSNSQQSRQYESDLIVVLDMDECLIHSKFLTSPTAAQTYAFQLRQQQQQQQQSDLHEMDQSLVVDSFRFHLPDGDLVHTNLRPGLEEFLEAITSKYETHIFTAAMSVYADPILDRLDPDGTRFAQRYYRESCHFDADAQCFIKNLRTIKNGEFDEGRIVLVDNNPLSFMANPCNGILVDNFYHDPTDKTLPQVLQLIEELDTVQDVRPHLERRFRLTEYFSESRARGVA